MTARSTPSIRWAIPTRRTTAALVSLAQAAAPKLAALWTARDIDRRLDNVHHDEPGQLAETA